MDKRLWISGYRSYEIGVFGNNDPKLEVIKRALRDNLKNRLENDELNWIITGGQMGSEQWAVEVGAELRNNYPNLKISVMVPTVDFGAQWNDNNKERLGYIRSLTDFTDSVSNAPYSSPQQLRNYQRFMLEHTDSALFIYDNDEENDGKSKYDIEAILEEQDVRPNYVLQLIDMQVLTDVGEEIAEEKRSEWY